MQKLQKQAAQTLHFIAIKKINSAKKKKGRVPANRDWVLPDSCPEGPGWSRSPFPAASPAGAALTGLEPDAVGGLDVLLRHSLRRHRLRPAPSRLFKLQPRRHPWTRRVGRKRKTNRVTTGRERKRKRNLDRQVALPRGTSWARHIIRRFRLSGQEERL